MVDPDKLLYGKDRTRYDQECMVLYIITVAGKTSEYATSALGRFLFYTEYTGHELPFDRIYSMTDDALDVALRKSRLSPYGWRLKAFQHVAYNFRYERCRDLTKLGPDHWANTDGERVGIGPKTSRYICMCLDPKNARYAALDTHLLKWMRHLGHIGIPKSTPPAGSKYNRIERLFLDECTKRGRVPAELDYEVWAAYKYGTEIPK